MINDLKKFYANDLVHLSLMLLLLRIDIRPVEYHSSVIRISTTNLTDELETSDYWTHVTNRIHPKSVNVISDFHQDIIYELNSLGRYSDIFGSSNSSAAYPISLDLIEPYEVTATELELPRSSDGIDRRDSITSEQLTEVEVELNKGLWTSNIDDLFVNGPSPSPICQDNAISHCEPVCVQNIPDDPPFAPDSTSLVIPNEYDLPSSFFENDTLQGYKKQIEYKDEFSYDSDVIYSDPNFGQSSISSLTTEPTLIDSSEMSYAPILNDETVENNSLGNYMNEYLDPEDNFFQSNKLPNVSELFPELPYSNERLDILKHDDTVETNNAEENFPFMDLDINDYMHLDNSIVLENSSLVQLLLNYSNSDDLPPNVPIDNQIEMILNNEKNDDTTENNKTEFIDEKHEDDMEDLYYNPNREYFFNNARYTNGNSDISEVFMFNESYFDSAISSMTGSEGASPLYSYNTDFFSTYPSNYADDDYSSTVESLFPSSSTNADGILNNILLNHTYYKSCENVEVEIKEEVICSTNETVPKGKENEISGKKNKPRQTKDEKRTAALNIPISVHDIINLPIDRYNEILSQYDLTDKQMKCIKDVRKRGKNKVAAQNCRKRKLDQITDLEGEVKQMKNSKDETKQENEYLIEKRIKHEVRLKALLNYISSHLECDDELKTLLDC